MIKKMILAPMLSILLAVNAYADIDSTIVDEKSTVEKPFSMGINIGSLGLGVNLSLPVNKDVSIRANINKFTYSLNKKYRKVDFAGDLSLLNAGLLVDYFPTNKFFRLTAGAYLNKNKVSGSSKFTKSVTVKIYNIKRTFTDNVTINTEVKFNNISPYVGIGFGNNIQKKGWNTTLDVGMMYQGLPKITFDTIAKYDLTKEKLKKDIEKEKVRLRKFADKYKLYPVIAVGISYSF